MSEQTIINLLVVEHSLSNAEKIVQILRSAGYVIQSTRVDNEKDLFAGIDYRPIDLIIARPAKDLPALTAIIARIAAANKDIPVLAMLDEGDTQTPLQLMRVGAAGVFALAEPEMLILAAGKELRHQQLRQQVQLQQIKIQEHEQRARTLLDNAHEAIAYIHEGAHIYANPLYLELFGYSDEQDLQSVMLMNLIDRPDRDRLKSLMRRSMKETRPLPPVELTGVHSSGGQFPIQLGCIPTKLNDEPCLQIIIAMPDKPLATVEPAGDGPTPVEISTVDELTGLQNRRSFVQKLGALLSTGKARGSVLYILMTDYRSISEQHGFEAVDHLAAGLATELSGLLKEPLAGDAVLARFSDAVFTLYTPLGQADAVTALGEQISHSISEHTSHAAQRLVSTTSAIGICTVNEHYNSAAQVLIQADRACETARQNGTNQVYLFTPTTHQDSKVSQQDRQLLDAVREAVAHDRLQLYFQPIANFQDNQQERYKTLLQLHGPDQQPLPIEQAFSVAERYNLAGGLDQWMIIRTLETLTERYQISGTALTLFVPLSSVTVADDDFTAWLRRRLQDTGLPGEMLVIEISEDHAEQYFNEVRKLRSGLQALNCRFALSHFGGKDNSLRLLKVLQPDYIKLDSALLEKQSRAKDEASRQALTALSEQAQEAGIHIIAEDIASAPQMASLWQYGITLVQGDMVQGYSPRLDFDFQQFVG